MRILIVEDEKYNRQMIKYLMNCEGYDVDEIDNPDGALQLIQRSMPQLFLLDINFGAKRLDGFELYRKIRELDKDVPVIFITARKETEDEIKGLALGADDYITKPFTPALLAARVKTVLNRVYRGHVAASQVIKMKSLELNISELTVVMQTGKTIILTPTEMKLLKQLMSHPDSGISRDDLLYAVWGDTYIGDSNIVDSYIRKLRSKLEKNPSKPQYILTVRGVGYKFSNQ